MYTCSLPTIGNDIIRFFVPAQASLVSAPVLLFLACSFTFKRLSLCKFLSWQADKQIQKGYIRHCALKLLCLSYKLYGRVLFDIRHFRSFQYHCQPTIFLFKLSTHVVTVYIAYKLLV